MSISEKLRAMATATDPLVNVDKVTVDASLLLELADTIDDLQAFVGA